MRIYNGLLVDDNEIKRSSKFVSFGEMADGSKCFHELDENGNEKDDFWFSMSRKKINGKNYTLFFLEGK